MKPFPISQKQKHFQPQSQRIHNRYKTINKIGVARKHLNQVIVTSTAFFSKRSSSGIQALTGARAPISKPKNLNSPKTIDSERKKKKKKKQRNSLLLHASHV